MMTRSSVTVYGSEEAAAEAARNRSQGGSGTPGFNTLAVALVALFAALGIIVGAASRARDKKRGAEPGPTE
jgi:hypothetical protein